MRLYHALYKAQRLSNYAYGRDKLVPVFASSNIELYPYQIAAALFALRSPYLKGAILYDDGYTMAGIDCAPGGEFVEFGNTEILPLVRFIGDIDENQIKREKIRRKLLSQMLNYMGMEYNTK